MWRARYLTPDGKKRSAGTYTHKRMAERKGAAAEDNAHKFLNRDSDASKRTWGDWCDHWWSTRDVAPSTLVTERAVLEKHLRPKWGKVALKDITRHDVRAWVAELRAKGLSPNSISRYLTIFTGSLSAAVDAEILSAHPASNIKFDRGEVDAQRYLTHEEEDRLMAVLSERDRAVVNLLLYTGMRWGEMMGLQIKRVDLKRRNIRIAEAWDSTTKTLRSYPKGRHVRDVPIFPDTVPHLEALIDGRTDGFAVADRLEIHNWRNRVWNAALEDAELGHVRIHDMRHTYASWLLQNGVPLAEVGKLLGHTSPATTQRYAHLADTPRDHIFAALSAR